MTINKFLCIALELKDLQSKGGRTYTLLSSILQQEATTENIAKAAEVLTSIKDKHACNS